LEQIIALYIGFSKQYIEKNFVSEIMGHRSEIELKEYDEGYMNPDNFIWLHSQLKERCRKYNEKFLEIHDVYENKMNTVYNWIDEQVEAKRHPSL
jgi:hypothetical protein